MHPLIELAKQKLFRVRAGFLVTSGRSPSIFSEGVRPQG